MLRRWRSRIFFGLGVLLAASCSGVDGVQGPAGPAALIRTAAEPAGANCPYGGTAIQAGTDENGDGTLDDAEVDSTAYVCNGAGGASGAGTLVRLDVEPAGANCTTGGTAVHAGVDDNANGTLEETEIDSTAYVCSGAAGPAGATALVRLDAEPAGANCVAGGVAVHAGLDADGSGALEDAEITSTAYVCNGAQPKKDGILFLQPGLDFFDPSTVTLIGRSEGKVWSFDATGEATALAPDPDGESFWVSTSSGDVQRRDLRTGALLNTVAFSSARDMVVVPSLGRLYVSGYQQVGVIDLSTRTLADAIALNANDQTLAISASPDGSQILQGAFDGSNSFLVFISTATNTVVQRLSVPRYPYDNLHLGNRVITWNDSDDELRVYTGTPWAEEASQRVSLVSDGSASVNALHNIRYNPADGRLYVFRSSTAEVLAFTASDTTDNSAIPTTEPYTCLLLDVDGTGLLGIRYPPNTDGLEHVALPSGTRTASPIDTSGLASRVVLDMWNVQY
jgi:DNA-binding beta-propeller fold protein YncE